MVLLLTFGSLFSMLLPILTAAMSVGTAVAIIGMVTHTMDIARVSPEIAALMGLGVGVDYALFIVSRYYFAVKAVTSAGVESALSNIVSKTIS